MSAAMGGFVLGALFGAAIASIFVAVLLDGRDG